MKNKLFTGAGFLTEEGRLYFENFQNAINAVFDDLNKDEELTEEDVRLIGCVLAKLSGDKTSERLVSLNEKNKIKNIFWAMSDEEFEQNIKNKYGPQWHNTSLTPEESERYEPIIKKQVDTILKQIEEDRAKAPPFYPQLSTYWHRSRRSYK